MKWPIALSVCGFWIGMISLALAGTPQPSDPVSSLALPGTTTGAKPEGTPNEKNTDENDDTLYRGKTSESENPMLRDEGPLHFKTRRKEKIQEVDSLKKLQTGGSDPKFQSNLLYSGVSSIENLGAKGNDTPEAEDETDPRFKTRRLVFTPEKNDQPKKAQSDSSPSPTPSPTASPAAKSSSKENPSPNSETKP
jgi:hypothetical protein